MGIQLPPHNRYHRAEAKLAYVEAEPYLWRGWLLTLLVCVGIMSGIYGASAFAQPATTATNTGQDLAAKNGQQLLALMNAAFTDLAYDGEFNYFSGDELASLRVVHKVVDGVARERLVHLNGAPREIIRHGDQVDCYVLPGDDLLSLEDSIPSGPFARAFVREFERLSTSYVVEKYGEGRVAGRAAIRIAVKPKDEHRYGYRLWLDRENALLLRSELIDANGANLEIFQFSRIVFGDQVDDAALMVSPISQSKVNHLRLAFKGRQEVRETNSHQAQWQTNWLPQGYKMAMADIKTKPNHAVTNLMYSDGLAAFSIFVEPMPKTGAASMVSQRGATVALNHAVQQNQQSFLVTLVGEIPVATAHKIIESVSLLPN